MADLLSDYLKEVRRLLHDANANYWSDDDLSDYINQGRNHIVTDTGCLRTYQTAWLQPNTEFYVFGGVWYIAVTDGGSAYTSAPTVALSTGSGATAGTITFSSGAIATIPVSAGGSGYTDPPTVLITGNGSGADAHAVLTAGVVTSIVVDSGGTGYTSATATLAAIGSGATATATVTSGVVTGITVNAQGTLYNSAPAVSFSGGGGSGAAATAYILTASTVDLINPMIIWGSQRIPLAGKAFTDLNAAARVWTTYRQRPGIWAMYGTGGICVAPVPDQAYQFDADTVILPTVLTGSLQGPLISPATEAVPYWASYLAKLNEKQFEEADAFKTLYYQQVGWAVNIYTFRGQGVYGGNANFDTFD